VELTELRRGALLHDVGKLGVHTAILPTCGPLNDVEWDEMRLHPGYGHQILEEIPSLAGAAGIVHCLHERWDGRGYPHGLRGGRDSARRPHRRARGCLGRHDLGPPVSQGVAV